MMNPRFLACFAIVLFCSFGVFGQVRVLPGVDRTPEEGSFFNWTYVEGQKVLFYPILKSSMLSTGEIELDNLRGECLTFLRSAFPRIEWENTSAFPSNKKGPLSRTRVKFKTMIPFVVEDCSEHGVRSGLIARVTFQANAQGAALFQCEMVLVDAEAGCAAAQTIGWADTEAGLQAAVLKSAELLAEQHLYVVRPKIAFNLIVDVKGKRTGASIPVGSRVGLIEDSMLMILKESEGGGVESVGSLEVDEEGTAASACKIAGVGRKVELHDGMLCVPIDRDAYKKYKTSNKRRSTGR